jgi:hypothetical protein
MMSSVSIVIIIAYLIWVIYILCLLSYNLIKIRKNNRDREQLTKIIDQKNEKYRAKRELILSLMRLGILDNRSYSLFRISILKEEMEDIVWVTDV